MRKEALSWTSCLLWAVVPVAHGDAFIGVGGGVKHTRGPAVHVNFSVYRAYEAHYSLWQDGEDAHALGLGYRFHNDSPVSLVFGFAYVSRVTQNLLHHNDAYMEVRWRFNERFACQVGHYSMVGDDAGENMLFCGVQFLIGPRSSPPDAEPGDDPFRD